MDASSATTVFVLLLLLALLLVGAVLMWGIGTYTGLVAASKACTDAFAQVAESLRRRYGLLGTLAVIAEDGRPSAVATFAAVAAARDAAMAALKATDDHGGDARAMARLDVAEARLANALGGLLAMVEFDPWARVDRNLQQLTRELLVIENGISLARQAYNAAATRYNERREAFPASLVAGFGHFVAAGLLAIDVAEKREPATVASG
ncbi:MAG: LemA family protein [Proteobacteria bacterium]|nr:LemA family protein [Pseudomonadota bacterium]